MKVKELKELLKDVDDELDVQYRFGHTCGFEPKNIKDVWHGKYYLNDGYFHEISSEYKGDIFTLNFIDGTKKEYEIKRFFSITVEK